MAGNGEPPDHVRRTTGWTSLWAWNADTGGGMAELAIFVINLDRAAARMQRMAQRFAALGLQPLRVAAVDAAAPAFAAPGYAPGAGDRWALLPVEQAIFESHRQIWQRMVDQDLPAALICEDDLLLSRDLPQALADLDPGAHGVIKLDGFSAARRYGPLQGDLRAIAEPVPSAACYALSQSAARQLLQDSQQYCATLDDFVFAPRVGLQPMQRFPALAVQEMCVSAPTDARVSALARPDKGPLGFRLRQELRRGLRRLRRKLGGDRALIARGGVIARPDLAPDLPPYRS